MATSISCNVLASSSISPLLFALSLLSLMTSSSERLRLSKLFICKPNYFFTSSCGCSYTTELSPVDEPCLDFLKSWNFCFSYSFLSSAFLFSSSFPTSTFFGARLNSLTSRASTSSLAAALSASRTNDGLLTWSC